MYCAVLDTNAGDAKDVKATGTGVPVFATSRSMKISDYFDVYNHLNIADWCPQSPEFMNESMQAGASEMRVKSRLAFMDSMETGALREMERELNKVLNHNPGSEIRVMIVCSLAGGTGSGMFIQVALWLRKFLENYTTTIRGIFMLPDVLISNLRDVGANRATSFRHYANTYAAIRELNALTKIMKGDTVELEEPIVIDGLFDSRVDVNSGKSVYDFAFFVDNKDENGVALNDVAEYEQMIAQLIFMQMYAPMSIDMTSEEDNTFLSFSRTDEPLFSACGTAKAVYPAASVKTYAAIRAAQDSLTTGWQRIDAEIEAKKEELKQRRKAGEAVKTDISVRAEYIRIYEYETTRTAEQVGQDRFFLTIAHDAENETKVMGEGDKIDITYEDKVVTFMKFLDKDTVDGIVGEKSGTKAFILDKKKFVEADHTVEYLKKLVQSGETGLNTAIGNFVESVPDLADEIVDNIFPLNMSKVTPNNPGSFYNLLAKANDNGEFEFIHPVAARYVMYKLQLAIEEAQSKIVAVIDKSKKDAETGGDVGAKFDNSATVVTEDGPIAFLDSKKWYQRESDFLDEFERRYADFINTKIGLVKKYQKLYLLQAIYTRLTKRLELIIKGMENFFEDLADVQKELNNALVENLSDCHGAVGKILYVLGDQASKEAIYQSMDFELEASNAKINKGVVDAVYGCICAEKRPTHPGNEAYLDIDVSTAFLQEIILAFREKLTEPGNSKKVNLDIYTAISKESDVKAGVDSKAKKSKVDFESGAVVQSNADVARHNDAFDEYKDRLFRLSAPFLQRKREVSRNKHGIVTTREKTFWGFSPELPEAYKEVGAVLGVNADIQADKAYPASELYCFRAVYGLEATYIPKFNELEGGDYYTSYKFTVDEMVADAEGRQGERAYVRTPHLDKRWHKLLPYITTEKREQEENEFFQGLWLAIAYGYLKTNNEGKLILERTSEKTVAEEVPLVYKKKPLDKTDVVKLISVLKTDKVFTDTDIPTLKKRFIEEIEDIDNYDIPVMKGLMPKKDDLHPVDLISRYYEAPKNSEDTLEALLKALESLAEEIAMGYDADRKDEELAIAKFRLCRRIYDSSNRSKGKSAIFSKWEKVFEQYKI